MNNKKQIELGDTVRDIHTGFTGVATVWSKFFNGCVQYAVVAKWDKKDKNPPEEIGIDEKSLMIIKRGSIYKAKQEQERKEVKESPGGPMRKAPRMRGF